MNSERALEIIAAYGADARRWPDAERGGVLALVAADAGVAAALAEARGLDGWLAGWAGDVAPRRFDAEAIMATAQVPVMPRTSPVRRWFASSALAVAVAVGLALVVPRPVTTEIATNSPVPSATVEGDVSGSDADDFALVFTPTIDEDELI
ncbi:hypothetical protein GCM10011529_18000 [Polymorphobacter glacialis]|uniref:Uncharacterized protein n=1 Tax=Sandarakinorhabdus glacialis TaxID=1614636 RepID=A0A916ZT95_9SPHN|nr:hypothetical protein [Polymorphobacter glacialis]GGE12066.1 hypothetical protein GCM10011529_18000 [Polymorphobacter glacialis]